MPNNSELKKALEKASKQIVLKNRQIEELNAKLSHFLYLEEINSQKASKEHSIDTCSKPDETTSVSNVDVKVDTEAAVKVQTETPVSTPLEPIQELAPVNDQDCVNVEIVEGSVKAVKKRSRSIWRLYLW
jgi:hypothetical protein